MTDQRDYSDQFEEKVDEPQSSDSQDGTRKPNGSGGGRPQIPLVAFDDIKLGTELSYLVKGLIPRTGLAVVWGPPKCGKSFWTFDLTMHVALGWIYRGRKVQQGGVVYCAFEGAEGFKPRAEAFRRAHIDAHNVPFYLVAARMNMAADHRHLIASIHEQLGDQKPVAVVLDTLNRSMAGSESDDEDMGNYVKAADAIREAFGCVVIIVHHCGTEGTRPRGHTSLTGAVDAQLAVKRAAGGNILVKVEYMKDGAEGAEIISALKPMDVGTDDDGDAVTSCVVLPSDETIGTATSDKLKGAAKIALDALYEAIAECGETIASNHIPQHTRSVSTDQWRQYCFAKTITQSDDPDNKRRSFDRVSQQLHAKRAIGVWQDRVWPAKQCNQIGNTYDYQQLAAASSRTK